MQPDELPTTSPLASADTSVRLDDLRDLAAGLLERLAREQRFVADRSAEERFADAIATTRGEAARALTALFDVAEYHSTGEDMAHAQWKRLVDSGDAIPSATLEAWAAALRSNGDRLSPVERALLAALAVDRMAIDDMGRAGFDGVEERLEGLGFVEVRHERPTDHKPAGGHVVITDVGRAALRSAS